jgi:hypothetical protein
LPCLDAGLRAAVLPHHVRVELSGHHAPGPADAMRGPPVFAGLRAERAVHELLRAAVSPRDVPLVTRRPRRANRQGRACATHAFGPRTSGELHAGPLASRAARDAAAARRVHRALLTRARRRRACAQRFEPGTDPCICLQVRGVTPRRDAPAAVASSPATGSTRRTPSARPRTRAPVPPAHPSVEPRRERGTFLFVTSWARDTQTGHQRRAARPLCRLAYHRAPSVHDFPERVLI